MQIWNFRGQCQFNWPKATTRSRITANDYEHSLTGMAHSRLTLQSGIVMEDSNSNPGLGDVTQN